MLSKFSALIIVSLALVVACGKETKPVNNPPTQPPVNPVVQPESKDKQEEKETKLELPKAFNLAIVDLERVNAQDRKNLWNEISSTQAGAIPMPREVGPAILGQWVSHCRVSNDYDDSKNGETVFERVYVAIHSDKMEVNKYYFKRNDAKKARVEKSLGRVISHCDPVFFSTVAEVKKGALVGGVLYRGINKVTLPSNSLAVEMPTYKLMAMGSACSCGVSCGCEIAKKDTTVYRAGHLVQTNEAGTKVSETLYFYQHN